MRTIRTLLADARQTLMQQLGLPADEARLEARLLLLQRLQVDHAWLLAHEADSLPASTHDEFQALLQRRLSGEPIAHILGQREFYGLALTVTPDTLIPRPDTETLVEVALARIPHPPSPRSQVHRHEDNPEAAVSTNQEADASRPFKVLDLGTGTGAIALAIASQRPQIEIVAVDASAAALAIASANAERLHLDNVRFLQSDWFAQLEDALDHAKFDIIVSNPPYIADDDPHLARGDLRFEPRSALASGADGLDDTRRIIRAAPQYLQAHGWLMLEHGYDQAEAVADLLRQAGFQAIGQARDLAGIVRVCFGQSG